MKREGNRTARRCKACRREEVRSARARGASYIVRDDARKNAGKGGARHLLSGAEYAARVQLQGGVCAICQQPTTASLSVDHDHVTNQVRGLLCRNCNVGLGFFRDNSSSLRAAAEYLDANAVTALTLTA